MTFTRIKPYGDDAYTYWISGIYKIVSYRAGEFLAFYIRDDHQNWGDYVSPPPDNGKHGKCWSTLKAAKSACAEHAKTHSATAKTVKRAAEIKAALIEQAAQYAEAA
jgi:hypothetical protein